MTITSKYNSVCPICGGKIKKGSEVHWVKGEKAVHINCYNNQNKDITEQEKVLLQTLRNLNWTPAQLLKYISKNYYNEKEQFPGRPDLYADSENSRQIIEIARNKIKELNKQEKEQE